MGNIEVWEWYEAEGEEIGQSPLEYVEFETTARYPRGAGEWIYKRSSVTFLEQKEISKI